MQNLQSFKKWSYGIVLFLVLVLIDFLSKKWAFSWQQDHNFGFIKFGLSHLANTLSFLEQKKLILRVIHYTTFLGPLMLLYLFFSYQLLNLERTRNMNLYLAVWVAGIVGNILDRILHGMVIEFVQLNVGFELFLNLSTIFMVIGCVGFFVQLYQSRDDLVFSNKRKMRLLQAGFQFDYVSKILFVSLFLCLTFCVFSYTFMRFYLAEYNVFVSGQILKLYLTQMLVISILYLLIIVLIGFHLSNRYVGPLHAFEKFIEKLEKGDMEATFHLRENDHHRNLEPLAQIIKKHWRS